MFRKKSTIILLAGILTLCSVAGIIYYISSNHGQDQTSLDYSSPPQETDSDLTENNESDIRPDPSSQHIRVSLTL